MEFMNIVISGSVTGIASLGKFDLYAIISVKLCLYFTLLPLGNVQLGHAFISSIKNAFEARSQLRSAPSSVHNLNYS